MRHADFVVAKDYKALEIEAEKWSKLIKLILNFTLLRIFCYYNDNVDVVIKSLQDYINSNEQCDISWLFVLRFVLY
jgi:hypothetical protein